MRILVTADDPDLRAARVGALERLEAETVGTCDLARLAFEVRTHHPDVLLLDGLTTGQEARGALKRARGASQRPLGAILLMLEGATWLRVPVPPDAQPAVALRSTGLEDAALRRALDHVRNSTGVRPGTAERYGLTLDRRLREAWTEHGRVRLTQSEATVLETLLDRPSEVVRHDDLARVLYGRLLTDSRTRATIDVQVVSLRQKLEALQVADQLEGLRAIGYRFVERRRARVPPRR